MKLYNSINTLPIFNYWMLYETKDFRYLMKDLDYDDLPDIEITNEFYKAYEHILNSNKDIDITLHQLYFDAITFAIKYLDDKTPENEQKCNVSFHNYLKKLDSNLKNYKYKNEIFETSKLLYDFKKKELTDWNDFVVERVLFFNFQTIQAETKGHWNLDDDIVIIADKLHIQINPKEISVKQFNAYKEYIYKQQQQLKQKQDGKKN